MPDLMVVASPTTSPLSTAVPLPTDGLPEWWRCVDCGERAVRDDYPSCDECGGDVDIPDGPFPVTVAVWEEIWHCGRCKLPKGDVDGCYCGYVTSYPVGAVVATVEVTGPPHEAAECVIGDNGIWQACAKFVPLTGWHTPTGTVTVLPEPIPCERPWSGTAGTPDRPVCGSLDTDGAGPCVLSPPLGDGSAHVHHGAEDVGRDPASWWFADLDLEVTV